MKNFYPTAGILILLLNISQEMIWACPVGSPGYDTTGLIDFTLFPRSDPFQSDEIIKISLKFDMKSLVRNKYKEEYQKAQLTVHNLDTDTVAMEIRVRARGDFRKDHCHFPPIKLSFKNTESGNEYLNDIISLKLVTHCKNSALYEQYILREYLVYRMFNMLTDSSFRVRLVQIDYIDSENRMKPLTKLGFIIESTDHLAERLKGVRIDRKGINTWDTDLYFTNFMTVFQYMIGNTDWAIPPLHNIKLIKPLSPTSGILAVPFDFDYSGMVYTHYALPAEELGIETVRTRIYLGYCLPSDDYYQSIFKVFLEKKEAIFSLVENFEWLDKKSRPEMLVYLEEFYKTIENPWLIAREIIGVCRQIPRW